MKKFFLYWSSLIEGKDNKPSVRRVMAVFVLAGLVRHVEKCPHNADIAAVLAGLITALLALTTWQNIKDAKPKNENSET